MFINTTKEHEEDYSHKHARRWGCVTMWDLAMSNNAGTRVHTTTERVGKVNDWNGNQLRKGIFAHLQAGDIVRAVVSSVNDGKVKDAAAPYFKITKVKHGTFWGKLLDSFDTAYGMANFEVGDMMSFRANNIMEVPISWQRKKQRRVLEQYVIKGKCKGITGMTADR